MIVTKLCNTLKVDKVIDTGKVYATNVMPDGNTLLVHDLCGGVILINDITVILNRRSFFSKIIFIAEIFYF